MARAIARRRSMSCAMRLTPLTEKTGNELFNDVWAARDGYIDVVLDRSAESSSASFSIIRSIALTPNGTRARTAN